MLFFLLSIYRFLSGYFSVFFLFFRIADVLYFGSFPEGHSFPRIRFFVPAFFVFLSWCCFLLVKTVESQIRLSKKYLKPFVYISISYLYICMTGLNLMN